MNRDPVDTCLSCYTRFFTDRVDFSNDLGELGRYYRSYHKLMNHWREVLPPGSFLDVRYENVVADLEGQSRQLLEYCGLSWEPEVLKFYRLNRRVRTASSEQVRRPLYTSSVGRSRPYWKHLAPLVNELGDLATQASRQEAPAS